MAVKVSDYYASLIGLLLLLETVEKHGKKWRKTWQTFVKIAKITAKKDTASNHGNK